MVGAFLLRFCIQLTLLGCALSSSMFPHIIPHEEEIVKNSGDNTMLECSSTKPVHWLNSTDTSYQEVSFDGNYYISKLFIHNASYLDTGNYVCSVDDSAEYHSSIYVYFRGCALSSSIQIIPHEEKIVKNSGDNIMLECSNTKPVHWLNSTDTSYQEVYFDGNYYISKLFIHNANYLDTGNYVCSVDDSAEYHSSIYVYFRDPVNLLATDDIFIHVTGIQYRTVVFPCRTTAPDVEVLLIKNDEEVTPDIFREEGGNMSYNPSIGFTLENINFKDGGIYECIATHGSVQHGLVINLHVLPHSDSVPKPYMNISDDTRIEEDDNITILCTVEMPANALFHMHWIYEDQEQFLTSNDHIKISNATLEVNNKECKKGRTTLSITQAKPEDTGTYKCEITDLHNNNKNSIEKRITVSAKNSSYLNVTVQGKQHYEMDARHNIKWVVYIMAHPWPHIEWIGPNGNVIDNSTARHRVYADEAQTYISITDLQINDAGIYTLKVENNYGTEIRNFSLVVRDGPAVEIDSNDIKDYYMLDLKN